MNEIKVNAPKSANLEESTVISESEAYKIAANINEKDKKHQAKVENGELKVQQVLKG